MRIITENETWEGLELSYSYELVNGGVSQVNVIGKKSLEGAELQISRRYWRDMTFAPTQSENMLSQSENEHIADVVSNVWDTYPDIQLEIPEVEHINE